MQLAIARGDLAVGTFAPGLRADALAHRSRLAGGSAVAGSGNGEGRGERDAVRGDRGAVPPGARSRAGATALAVALCALLASCAGPGRQGRAAPPSAPPTAAEPAGEQRAPAQPVAEGAPRAPDGDRAAESAAATPEPPGRDRATGAPAQRAQPAGSGPQPGTGSGAGAGARSESERIGPDVVRAAVSAAALETGGQMAERCARALEALADLLDRMGGGARAADSTTRMREEARAVAGLRPVDLERADRVKGGLEAGVDAMRSIARSLGARSLEEWIGAAAASVDAIDTHAPLGLQDAVVQDALRALADAVLLAWQLEAG